MNATRTIATLVVLAIVGVIGYQIGVSQNIAAQLPAGTAVAPYYYGPHWFGFGFGFLGFLFPLFFLFLIFGLLRAAMWGGRGWGGGYGHMSRRERLEDIHRELHGEKPQSGGTSSTST
jgi:hypothetical protein